MSRFGELPHDLVITGVVVPHLARVQDVGSFLLATVPAEPPQERPAFVERCLETWLRERADLVWAVRRGCDPRKIERCLLLRQRALWPEAFYIAVTSDRVEAARTASLLLSCSSCGGDDLVHIKTQIESTMNSFWKNPVFSNADVVASAMNFVESEKGRDGLGDWVETRLLSAITEDDDDRFVALVEATSSSPSYREYFSKRRYFGAPPTRAPMLRWAADEAVSRHKPRVLERCYFDPSVSTRPSEAAIIQGILKTGSGSRARDDLLSHLFGERAKKIKEEKLRGWFVDVYLGIEKRAMDEETETRMRATDELDRLIEEALFFEYGKTVRKLTAFRKEAAFETFGHDRQAEFERRAHAITDGRKHTLFKRISITVIVVLSLAFVLWCLQKMMSFACRACFRLGT